MPFVKFVENDNAVRTQASTAQQSLSQDAFGEIPQPCTGAAGSFKAHLKADSLANRLAHFLGNAPRRHARRQTARFEHVHLVESSFEESRWNTRGFTGAGLGL
jgi:hypothetical protein